MPTKTYLQCSLVALFAAACGLEGQVPSAPATTAAEQQREAWGAQDNPSLFDSKIEFRLDALPGAGEASTIPWAGSYWPTYEDNINYKWAGSSSMSPAKKYGVAFYQDRTDVESLVSRNHGIESVAKTCKTDSECSTDTAETCVKRNGADQGRCIASWWGICHAWAPAAILFPEPRKAVTRNGVTFEVPDLKALGTLVHNNTSAKMVSLRCNKTDSAIKLDSFGRPVDADRNCRDTNAGTYHLLIANYLGLRKQSFVEDRTNNYEVWNQPLRGFSVLAKTEVSAAEANRLVGATGDAYQFNTKAVKFFKMKMRVDYISESSAEDGYTAPTIQWYTRADTYEYILELDAAGKIVGGEWLGSSKTNHPDFLWLPVGVNTKTVAGGSISYDVVKQLVYESAGLSTAVDAGMPRVDAGVRVDAGSASDAGVRLDGGR